MAVTQWLNSDNTTWHGSSPTLNVAYNISITRDMPSNKYVKVNGSLILYGCYAGSYDASASYRGPRYR